MRKIEKIILCFDNSDLSLQASDVTLAIARIFDAEVVGIHGYNAFMHEGAFRIMEPILPEKYQREEVLQRQRKLHNSLINVGMEKISLSYLKPLEKTFKESGVTFTPLVKEGKNYKAVVELISETDGDLVIIGASGFNQNGDGFLGSVCLRVLRSCDRDFLVVKGSTNLSRSRIVVGLDGSASAVEALRKARLFAERLDAELHLVYIFDSKLHRDIFQRLKDSVINNEGFSFNSKEQERLHDQFIDRGLSQVGRMILDRAEQEVFGNQPGLHLEWGPVSDKDNRIAAKKVLEGAVYKKICEYASEVGADMIFVGRTGRHYIEGMDIGATAENVLRYSPCSVFISRHQKYEGWNI